MQITDPVAIRALAHPLRLDLLDLLTATGPATAAQCGRALGVSQASCSFHLRQLAKYGLVEEAGQGPDRRERQWRLPNPRPVVRVNTLAGDDGVGGRQLERIVVERETRAILDNLASSEPTKIVSAIALVSPEEADQLKAAWKALLEPYLARAPRPGRRAVRIFMAATPIFDQEVVP